jgi:capsule biosynthesis phosphatase
MGVAMNIILPIGGRGERFKTDGYRFPKPLINVFGKPLILWVLDNLNVSDDDKLFIVYNEELDNYNFSQIVKFRYKKAKNLNFIKINYYTRGAAETLLCGLNQIPKEDMDNLTVSLDCDTFYVDDIITKCKENNNNLIFYFNDVEEKPIYSYIKTNNIGQVVEIKEKIKISDNANTGAYCFRTANLLKSYCEKLISTQLSQDKKEYYVSLLYDMIIRDMGIVYSAKVEKFHCLGTPEQVQSFCLLNQEKTKPKRFCFDLDNTLVTYPVIDGDYTSVLPIQTTIDYVKSLKRLGHTIIIYTARRMKTHSGNVGAIIADVGKITIDTLAKYDIPYDELYFGKPYADFYIDDLGVNPYYDMPKELGFYKDTIDARSFNSIEFQDKTIIKRSKNGKSLGEITWYRHLTPNSIASIYVPKLISHNSDETEMTIERVDGIPVSLLYINGSMTNDILNSIFRGLYYIHIHQTEHIDIPIDNCFYTNKLRERYESYDYSYLGPDIHNEYLDLMSKLSQYEQKISQNTFIHGDSVLTNILLTKKSDIMFIDMRGTVFGDKLYDYAKLYQSIIGYDFILNDKPINDDYVNKWKTIIERNVTTTFTDRTIEDLKLVTRSLLFTLIPLHNNEKCHQYYKLIKDIK